MKHKTKIKDRITTTAAFLAVIPAITETMSASTLDVHKRSQNQDINVSAGLEVAPDTTVKSSLYMQGIYPVNKSNTYNTIIKIIQGLDPKSAVLAQMINRFHSLNWRQLFGRIVGLYYTVFGIFTLYVLSATINIATISFEGLLPEFDLGSTGYDFSVGMLPLLIQMLLLISSGIMLVWRLKRWAAINGIIGMFVPSLTSLALEVLISASGGPPLIELVSIKNIVLGWGLFIGLPALGVTFAWRDLH
jgi:hypothetical protein